ncbi:aspartyl-phosphate phosphatase Spo0E family protein [Metabacillus litoralis]|nr:MULTISPECIES: aspartyl-phosphate phosphatase Spo0E family protein [Bacillaceae]UHA60870.1 aspartyl-phosphate phosphatase Spo0E family protein [Metabacillus litoralis]
MAPGKDLILLKQDIEKMLAEKQQELNNVVLKYGLRSKEALYISQELDIMINQVMKEKALT